MDKKEYKFLKDNYKQIAFLFVFMVVAGYGLVTKDASIIDRVLTAALAVLNVNEMIKNND